MLALLLLELLKEQDQKVGYRLRQVYQVHDNQQIRQLQAFQAYFIKPDDSILYKVNGKYNYLLAAFIKLI